MVRELQIILGEDAVTLHLGVAREPFIFFEQLGRVAALPIVLAIARTWIVAARRPTTAAAAAAPAATLTIVDQTMFLTKGGSALPSNRRTRPGFVVPLDPGGEAPHSGTQPPLRNLFASDQAIGGRQRLALHASSAVFGLVPAPYVASAARKSKEKSARAITQKE
jgi:hypothetical protein